MWLRDILIWHIFWVSRLFRYYSNYSLRHSGLWKKNWTLSLFNTSFLVCKWHLVSIQTLLIEDWVKRPSEKCLESTMKGMQRGNTIYVQITSRWKYEKFWKIMFKIIESRHWWPPEIIRDGVKGRVDATVWISFSW